MDQGNLFENMVQFNNKSRPKTKKGGKKKTFESVNALYKGRELILNAFRSEIFPIKAKKKSKELRILTPKQMFQRLPTDLEQVKADNTPENLLNEIRQIK